MSYIKIFELELYNTAIKSYKKVTFYFKVVSTNASDQARTCEKMAKPNTPEVHKEKSRLFN